MTEPVITSFDALADLLGSDARFVATPIASQREGLIEIVGGGKGHIAGKSLALCHTESWSDPAKLAAFIEESHDRPMMVVLVGSEAQLQTCLQTMPADSQLALVDLPISPDRLAVLLRNYLDLVALRARLIASGRQAARYQYELSELVEISRALASERDISKLLGLILEKCRYVTRADAGSVYIVEGFHLHPRDRSLRFMVSQNDSLTIDFRQFTLKVDASSIVGHSVMAREFINIPDLYELDKPGKNPWGFRHDKQFDLKTGYQGHSMLTVPMINQNDEVIGVIQLINKKREATGKLLDPRDFAKNVIPFDQRAEELAVTLASQGGISLENTLLYEDIQKLFEGFVNAAVSAIEVRDPTTSGHSLRVATLTCRMAEIVDGITDGPYQGIRFDRDDLKEIEYAGLLHDFGKVGVSEKVLLKAKKLYDSELELILQRFDYIRKAIEAEYLHRQLDAIRTEGADPRDGRVQAMEAERLQRLAEIDEFIVLILHANEPTVLEKGGFEKLNAISHHFFEDIKGNRRPYLTPEELKSLSIERGTLTVDERLEIERHVVHTIQFLENIPWGRKFRHIPAIAGGHHEKLDGTGYPKRLPAEEILLESRMMTIADIFDALTASDRPYKPAVPLTRALDILGYEVKGGKCDGALLQVFIDSKAWTSILPE